MLLPWLVLATRRLESFQVFLFSKCSQAGKDEQTEFRQTLPKEGEAQGINRATRVPGEKVESSMGRRRQFPKPGGTPGSRPACHKVVHQTTPMLLSPAVFDVTVRQVGGTAGGPAPSEQ